MSASPAGLWALWLYRSWPVHLHIQTGACTVPYLEQASMRASEGINNQAAGVAGGHRLSDLTTNCFPPEPQKRIWGCQRVEKGLKSYQQLNPLWWVVERGHEGEWRLRTNHDCFHFLPRKEVGHFLPLLLLPRALYVLLLSDFRTRASVVQGWIYE